MEKSKHPKGQKKHNHFKQQHLKPKQIFSIYKNNLKNANHSNANHSTAQNTFQRESQFCKICKSQKLQNVFHRTLILKHLQQQQTINQNKRSLTPVQDYVSNYASSETIAMTQAFKYAQKKEIMLCQYRLLNLYGDHSVGLAFNFQKSIKKQLNRVKSYNLIHFFGNTYNMVIKNYQNKKKLLIKKQSITNEENCSYIKFSQRNQYQTFKNPKIKRKLYEELLKKQQLCGYSMMPVSFQKDNSESIHLFLLTQEMKKAFQLKSQINKAKSNIPTSKSKSKSKIVKSKSKVKNSSILFYKTQMNSARASRNSMNYDQFQRLNYETNKQQIKQLNKKFKVPKSNKITIQTFNDQPNNFPQSQYSKISQICQKACSSKSKDPEKCLKERLQDQKMYGLILPSKKLKSQYQTAKNSFNTKRDNQLSGRLYSNFYNSQNVSSKHSRFVSQLNLYDSNGKNTNKLNKNKKVKTVENSFIKIHNYLNTPTTIREKENTKTKIKSMNFRSENVSPFRLIQQNNYQKIKKSNTKLQKDNKSYSNKHFNNIKHKKSSGKIDRFNKENQNTVKKVNNTKKNNKNVFSSQKQFYNKASINTKRLNTMNNQVSIKNFSKGKQFYIKDSDKNLFKKQQFNDYLY